MFKKLKDEIIGVLVIKENCIIPKIWHIKSPIKEYFIPSPQKKLRNKNPIKNPPLAENSFDIPPLNPAKTGKPIAPSSRYINTHKVPFLLPRKKPQRLIAKVCKVKGTPKGLGIDTVDSIQVIAQNIAIMLKVLVFIIKPPIVSIL